MSIAHPMFKWVICYISESNRDVLFFHTSTGRSVRIRYYLKLRFTTRRSSICASSWPARLVSVFTSENSFRVRARLPTIRKPVYGTEALQTLTKPCKISQGRDDLNAGTVTKSMHLIVPGGMKVPEKNCQCWSIQVYGSSGLALFHISNLFFSAL